GLAQRNPNKIADPKYVRDNGDGLFTAKLPINPPYLGVTFGFAGDTDAYSTANGVWLKGLEKGSGWTIASGKALTWGVQPAYNYINRGNSESAGIEALTGHSTDNDLFWCTSESTTRQKLLNAFANGKVVTAGINGTIFADAEKLMKRDGLVRAHSYTV